MLSHRLWIPVLALCALAGSAPPAVADHSQSPNLANIEVRAVLSAQKGSRVFRAILAKHGRDPYVVIDVVGPGRPRQPKRILHQKRLDRAWFDQSRQQLPLYQYTRDIELKRWKTDVYGAELIFLVTTTNNRRYRCRVAAKPRYVSPVRCRSTGGSPQPGPLPQPPPVTAPGYGADADVIRACGQAFYGDRNEQACLRAVAKSRVHPARLIAACEKAIFGDPATLKCVEAAASARRDPSTAIAACADAMTGNDNTVTCIREARASHPSAIRACASAMTGDTNALSCIRLAARVRRGDPSALVRSCADSMTGDRAALTCLENATRYQR